MAKALLFTAIIGSLLTGCATTRTKYGPMTDSGGYSEKKIDEKLYVTRFAGNAYTHQNDASLFSLFRAVEICKDNGFKIARVYGTQDLSTSKTVQRTSNYSYQQPTYFNGTANSNTNYNYYGGGYGQANRNTNIYGTVSGGNTYGGSQSWEETYNFPTYDTVFSCTNQAYMLRVQLKAISADDMKPFVKDLMGAVQITSLTDDSPNKDILQPGDMVVRVNGARVQNDAQFISAVDSTKDKNKIPLAIIRDGKQLNISARSLDGTPMIQSETDKIIAAACSVPEVKKRPICEARTPASK